MYIRRLYQENDLPKHLRVYKPIVNLLSRSIDSCAPQPTQQQHEVQSDNILPCGMCPLPRGTMMQLREAFACKGERRNLMIYCINLANADRLPLSMCTTIVKFWNSLMEQV